MSVDSNGGTHVTDDPPSTPTKPAPAPIECAPERDEERPTVSPPFDIEAFARSTAALDSVDVPEDPKTGATGERATITNEVELELARMRSVQSTQPPRTRSSGALSIADARASSVPAPGSPSGSRIEVGAVLDVTRSSPPPEITQRTIEDPLSEMRERFSLGDYSGALEMAELILVGDPRSLEAAECGENCRSILEKMFAAKIGALERVPVVIVPRAQMRWLSIDHRAGFILSLVDGASSVEMILDVSGMPKLDALRILQDLVDQRIVAFRQSP
ncbi:MAG: hypothetical protein ABSC94_05075 [Polyangiaceae bacterium]|jgi:hypothetical protein